MFAFLEKDENGLSQVMIVYIITNSQGEKSVMKVETELN